MGWDDHPLLIGSWSTAPSDFQANDIVKTITPDAGGVLLGHMVDGDILEKQIWKQRSIKDPKWSFKFDTFYIVFNVYI